MKEKLIKKLNSLKIKHLRIKCLATALLLVAFGSALFSVQQMDSELNSSKENKLVPKAYAEEAKFTYKDGVYTYTSFPLKIFYTDAICWQLGCDASASWRKNELPERIQLINDLIINAIEEEIFVLGFKHPARTQNTYLVVKVEDGGFATNELSGGALGMASMIDGLPYIFIDPYQGGGYNKESLTKTLAHELFHIIQFSYDPKFDPNVESLNFSEGTATWMVRRLFEFEKYMYRKDYLDFYGSYYAMPNYSLYGINQKDKFFQYGTVLWAVYLESKFKTIIIKEIWEEYFREATRTGNYHNALYNATRTVFVKHGSNIEDVYADFAGWIFDKTQYRRDEKFFPDAPTIDMGKSPTDWRTVQSEEETPHVLGSTFVKFNTVGAKDDLYFSFQGNQDAKWIIDFYMDGRSGKYQRISVAMGDAQTWVTKFSKQNLTNKLVAVISPVNSKQIENGVDRALDYYYPFSFKFTYSDTSKSQTGVNEVQCPANSTMGVDGTCFCDEGYEANYKDGGCIKNKNVVSNKNNKQTCTQNLGSNAVYDPSTNSCICKEGYLPNTKWTSEKRKCIKAKNFIPTLGERICGRFGEMGKQGWCVCAKGYRDNGYDQCVKSSGK